MRAWLVVTLIRPPPGAQNLEQPPQTWNSRDDPLAWAAVCASSSTNTSHGTLQTQRKGGGHTLWPAWQHGHIKRRRHSELERGIKAARVECVCGKASAFRRKEETQRLLGTPTCASKALSVRKQSYDATTKKPPPKRLPISPSPLPPPPFSLPSPFSGGRFRLLRLLLPARASALGRSARSGASSFPRCALLPSSANTPRPKVLPGCKNAAASVVQWRTSVAGHTTKQWRGERRRADDGGIEEGMGEGEGAKDAEAT